MTFEEAQERVKVGHFTRQGFKLRGVVHVGANDGEEIEYYLALGATEVTVFEPLDSARMRLHQRWDGDPRVIISCLALSDGLPKISYLRVAEGDGKGSSFLHEFNPHQRFNGVQPCCITSFSGIHADLSQYNTLVVDVQGMELQVLRGFGEQLKAFDFLNIECSRVPLYEGEAPAQDVIDFLATQGFDQDSPIFDHDDIMFVKRGLK